MNIIAFNGSPRINGNTEIILKEVVKAIEEEGQKVKLIRPSLMKFSPCIHCGGCEKTGVCIINDDMTDVYEAIKEGSRFILASPIFFFALSAQMKALIDRCQAFWCEKYLLKKPIHEGPYGRQGLLITVGGMSKEVGFNCGNACATAFFRTINVKSHEHIFFPSVDAAGAIKEHPTALKDVYNAAKMLILKTT
ncbi:MAG: flavodoxin family protein [Candidatus Magnetoovum sp. WYHC-5]|nr:flavodoxin family protein [Candidatus Magnetoovum sp. WYHC-5]